MSSLLDSIKSSQRVVNNAVNQDFEELIEVCKGELKRLGVAEEKIDSEDAEILYACKLFVRANTDYLGKGETWNKRFNEFASNMSMHTDWMEVE